jgi:RNA polymerase sigma-70 factor (sigma-E family)
VTFEEYVATRGPALVRFARLLTGDRYHAEDLVQEALSKAYLRWDRMIRSEQPDAYLRRMVINASRSWWRRRTNRETPTSASTDRVAPGQMETETVERDEMWQRIARLPERQRTVLVLRYYEDLDDAAIAAILGCTAVTVRTHAMRALNTLRQHTNGAGTDAGARAGRNG